MSEQTGLAIIDQKPAEIVIGGRDAAKELTKIVGSRKRKLVMGGKQYLFFEDWQTIGKFYGVTAKVIHTEELREGDTLIGFLAQAVAVASGIEISAADAECTNDDLNWKSKPRFQLRSMAQTRACSKALRNCLGWVAVLAGYEPTPAEEMVGSEPVKPPARKTSPKDKGEGDDIPEQVSIETVQGDEWIPSSRDELAKEVAVRKGWKDGKIFTSYALNKCHIQEERLDSDPAGCWKEICELEGWS